MYIKSTSLSKLILIFLLTLFCYILPVYSALTDGNIRYYSFNNDSTVGAISIDSSGTRNGTINNLQTGVTGQLLEAYESDGSNNNYVNTSFSGSAQITVTAWINGSNNVDWVSSDDEASNRNFQFKPQTDHATGVIFHSGGALIVEGVTDVIDDNWHFVAFTSDGTNLTVYVDGNYENSGTISGTPNQAVQDILIFQRRVGSGASFDGRMDEVGIWNRSLNQSEIQELYNGGTGLNPYDVPQVASIGFDNITLNGVENFNNTIFNFLDNHNFTIDINYTEINQTFISVSMFIDDLLNETKFNCDFILDPNCYNDINNITFNKDFSEGIHTVKFNVTNGTIFNVSGVYNLTFDITAPTIQQIANITTNNTVTINFSNVFNVTDSLSGLNICTINITDLQPGVSTQDNYLINCTDTQTFVSAGLHNSLVNATDNAGNVATLSYNFTLTPTYDVEFINPNNETVANYTLTIHRPDNVSETASFVNSTTARFSPLLSNTSLVTGVYTFEFSKITYFTTNFTFNITENTTGQLLQFDVLFSDINVFIYDRSTGALLNGTNVTLVFVGQGNTTTTTGTASFESFGQIVPGNYTMQSFASGYYTEQLTFEYSGLSNATVEFYMLNETLETSSNLFVTVSDEFDNIISGADTRLLEYDPALLSFKQVSQCFTDSNGECIFLVEVGLKTYIITTQKVIGGSLFTAQSSQNGEVFQPEISGGEEILGRDIIRALKLQLAGTLSTPGFFGLSLDYPAGETETITTQNATTTTINIPITFTSTSGVYTVCLEIYRVVNTAKFNVSGGVTCTTSSSGVVAVSNFALDRDFDYIAQITATNTAGDKIIFKTYNYPNNLSFIEILKSEHYVPTFVMFFWVILMATALYLRNIALWVYGGWVLAIIQIPLFAGVLFASASVTIIIINAGVLYMAKRQGDTV